VRESVRAVQSGADSRFSLLGIVEDVTERFTADQARRQLVEILDSTSDFVERIAATGETLYLNRASRTLLNATKDPDVGDADASASPESVWNRAGDEELRRDRLRLADEEGVWQGELWLHGADGKPIPVSQVIISHRSSNGSTNSYSIISRDISAMREAQKALRETGEELFQAQKLESLGRLAGGIAHDFNNLLTIIMGHASVLEPAMEDHGYREGITAISRAATRAADLTRQLLAFGRKQTFFKGIVDVKEVVRGAERLLQRPIGGRIELIIRLGKEPQTVISDAAQLEHVLVNLILNARDAMPRGGVATIETSVVRGDEELANETSAREYVRISVSDTGIGMDEHTMTRVFEPFFTTKSSGNGTGLGLATAHGFIRQSGGSITVSSKPGAGSTFVILLPRSTAEVKEEPPEEEFFEAANDERILVVDDEPAVRGLLRQTLAGRGYLVTDARDAEEALALALASEEGFDLLITDVIMPGLTGPQLARHMTEMFSGLAVLFISGYPGETHSERAAFGARAGYLSKPFTAEILLRYARKQLERSRERTRHAGE
jgi:signal transduction histidine kinase/ActR/RegA family two-component response regulator